MPELPEVETVCRGLSPVMIGQVIERVDVRRKDLRKPFPAGIKPALSGARVDAITRRAKYVLIHLDTGRVLVIHLGMSGRILIERAGYRPKTHDHFILHMTGGRVIVLNDARRFGMVLLLGADEISDDPAFASLGPEPLSRQFTGSFLHGRLKGRKTAIKTAIMDQRIVVGVGNIYASESLFMAGIHPARPAGSLGAAEADSLVAAIRAILKKAIAKGGSTLQDHRQVDGTLGYFQHHFAVYGRTGQACPGCGCDILKTGGIRRVVEGGRSGFYCPRKQK